MCALVLNIQKIKQEIKQELGGKTLDIKDILKKHSQKEVFKLVKHTCYEAGDYKGLVQKILEEQKKIRQIKQHFKNSEENYQRLIESFEILKREKKKIDLVLTASKSRGALVAATDFSTIYKTFSKDTKQVIAARKAFFAEEKEKIQLSKTAIKTAEDDQLVIEKAIVAIDKSWKLFAYDKGVHGETQRSLDLHIIRLLNGDKATTDLSYNLNFKKNENDNWTLVGGNPSFQETFLKSAIIKANCVHKNPDNAFEVFLDFSLKMDKLSLTNKNTAKQKNVYDIITNHKEDEHYRELHKKDFSYKSKEDHKSKSNEKSSKKDKSWGLNLGFKFFFGADVEAKGAFASKFEAIFTIEFAKINAIYTELRSIHKELITIDEKSIKDIKPVDNTPKWVKILKRIVKIKGLLGKVPSRFLKFIPAFNAINKILKGSDLLLKLYETFGPKPQKTTRETTTKITEIKKYFLTVMDDLTIKSTTFRTSLEADIKLEVATSMELHIDTKGNIVTKAGLNNSNYKIDREHSEEIMITSEELLKAKDIIEIEENESNSKQVHTGQTISKSKTTESTETNVIVAGDFSLHLLCTTTKDGHLNIQFGSNKDALLKNGLNHSSDLKFIFKTDTKNLIGSWL